MKKMKVLIDTNVILDWMIDREPFTKNAKIVIYECIKGNIQGFITAHMLTDLFYILRKTFDVKKRKRILLFLCKYFEILSEDKKIMLDVLNNEELNDLEDGLQIVSAYNHNLDYIITRDTQDFKNSKVTVMLPECFVNNYVHTNLK